MNNTITEQHTSDAKEIRDPPPSPMQFNANTCSLPSLQDVYLEYVRFGGCEKCIKTNMSFIGAVEEGLPNTSFSRVIDSGYRNSTMIENRASPEISNDSRSPNEVPPLESKVVVGGAVELDIVVGGGCGGAECSLELKQGPHKDFISSL